MTVSSHPSTIAEARRKGGSSELVRLAYPIVLTQLSMSVMQIVDTAMVGRLGTTPLAATGLASYVNVISAAL